MYHSKVATTLTLRTDKVAGICFGEVRELSKHVAKAYMYNIS